MPEIPTRQSDRRQRRTARSTGVNSSNHFKNLLREGGKYELNKIKKLKVQRAEDDKNSRKVDFDATPIKAAKGAGGDKGGTSEGSGESGGDSV